MKLKFCDSNEPEIFSYFLVCMCNNSADKWINPIYFIPPTNEFENFHKDEQKFWAATFLLNTDYN